GALGHRQVLVVVLQRHGHGLARLQVVDVPCPPLEAAVRVGEEAARRTGPAHVGTYAGTMGTPDEGSVGPVDAHLAPPVLDEVDGQVLPVGRPGQGVAVPAAHDLPGGGKDVQAARGAAEDADAALGDEGHVLPVR